MLLKDLSGLTSPLNDQQIGQLQQAVAELSPQQLAWISGYFWGLSQTPSGEAAAPDSMPQASSAPNHTLTILYASQTGNAKGVAETLHQEAEAAGIPAKLVATDDYKGKQLTNMRSAGNDDAVKLVPPQDMNLERALEWIEDDELVEVTPKNIRIRKKILDPNQRKRAQKKNK